MRRLDLSALLTLMTPAHSDIGMRADNLRNVVPLIRLDRLVPVALLWSTAAMFLIAWLNYPSDSTAHYGKLMELEFAAIHAGAFLGFQVYWAPSKPLKRRLRVVGLILFCLLYAVWGYKTLGWVGVVELGTIIFVTYSGLLWITGAERKVRVAETFARWFVAFVVIQFVIYWTRLPGDVATWHQTAHSVLAGAIYFAVLGLFELSGIYRFASKIENR